MKLLKKANYQKSDLLLFFENFKKAVINSF